MPDDVPKPISGPTLTTLVYRMHGPEFPRDRIDMPDTSGGMACTAGELEQVRSMFAASFGSCMGQACECCVDCYKECCLWQDAEEDLAALKRLEKDLQTTFPHLDIVVENVWHKSRGGQDPDRWVHVVHIRPGGSGVPKEGMERRAPTPLEMETDAPMSANATPMPVATAAPMSITATPMPVATAAPMSANATPMPIVTVAPMP